LLLLVSRLRCKIGRFSLSRNELGSVMVDDGQKLFVVHTPQSPATLVFAKKSQMSQQLTKPDIRGKLTKFSQHS
jgi:hypothetical protein